jgi:hypothetical protein
MISRAEQLKALSPQLVADVTMYPPPVGRTSRALPGWGCPCCVSKSEPIVGYDGWPLLGDVPLEPSEKRRLGFVFLAGEEAASVMRNAGTFYLWEGKFIGEATVVKEA